MTTITMATSVTVVVINLLEEISETLKHPTTGRDL